MLTITDALLAEHVVLRAVFDEVEELLPDLRGLAQVKTITTLVERLLHRHGHIETELAFAALDHAMAEKRQFRHLYQEHEEIDDRLRQALGAKALTDARRLLKAAVEASRRHFANEERRFFPLIEEQLQGETLLKLGETWSRQRATT